MQLRYNFRVYPDAAQRRALARAFGCARVVWNDCLRDRKEAHEAGLPFVKSGELSRVRITQAKRTEKRGWLAEVSAVVLQQSLRDLDAAFKNFFDSVTGKRRSRRAGPPRFKSKKDARQSIRLTTAAFRVRGNGRVQVAKVGDLKVKWSRRLPAAPTSLTVTKDSAGRYFLSFVVDTEPDILPMVETDVGVDLGWGSGTAPSLCTSGSGHAGDAGLCTIVITTRAVTSWSKDAASSPPDGRRR
jgi:putative transposase